MQSNIDHKITNQKNLQTGHIPALNQSVKQFSNSAPLSSIIWEIRRSGMTHIKASEDYLQV